HLGIIVIGRIAWVVVPYIEIAILALILFVWRDIEWLHLFPLAGPGWLEVLREGAFHGGMFTELFLLALIFPYVRSPKEARIGSYIGAGISLVKIMLMIAVYLAVFDYPDVYQIAFPFHQLTKNAAAGQIVTHMESIFLAFWLITSVIFFAIYVYMLSFLFSGTLGMKKQTGKLALPLTGLVVL